MHLGYFATFGLRGPGLIGKAGLFPIVAIGSFLGSEFR